MELDKALEQISEIHGQLAKTDVYRGYKAVPVALSGVLAIVAAALQPSFFEDPYVYLDYFVPYWVGVALLGCAVAGSGVVYSYILQESPLARRRTRTVVGQLLPCLAAGVAVTAILFLLAHGNPLCVAVLPGLWAILFSLGVFASRPYLPHITGWVALYYLAAGIVLLLVAGDGRSLSPWGMGLTFGVGQLLSGVVLYWDLERNNVRSEKE